MCGLDRAVADRSRHYGYNEACLAGVKQCLDLLPIRRCADPIALVGRFTTPFMTNVLRESDGRQQMEKKESVLHDQSV